MFQTFTYLRQEISIKIGTKLFESIFARKFNMSFFCCRCQIYFQRGKWSMVMDYFSFVCPISLAHMVKYVRMISSDHWNWSSPVVQKDSRCFLSQQCKMSSRCIHEGVCAFNKMQNRINTQAVLFIKITMIIKRDHSRKMKKRNSFNLVILCVQITFNTLQKRTDVYYGGEVLCVCVYKTLCRNMISSSLTSLNQQTQNVLWGPQVLTL